MQEDIRRQGVSGNLTSRPQLARALKALKAGDTLVVWKLDRLGRSLRQLVTTIAELGERGINFRSLSDPIDTRMRAPVQKSLTEAAR